MKFNKRNLGQSTLESGTIPNKQIFRRKNKRKALKKQNKINRAINYAKIKHTNKVCISPDDVNNMKVLQNNNNLYSHLKNKILSNNNNNNNNNNNKYIDTKPKKIKKNKFGATSVKENSKNSELSSSFKMSSNSNIRLASLQEYVNQESKKLKKMENIANDKKDKPKDNLIKDKSKLKDLKLGQRNDEKEINKLARKLHLNAHQKKKILPTFVGFEGILEDIEEGTLSNLNRYKNDEIITYDFDENLENDMLIAIGKKKVGTKKEIVSNQDEGSDASEEEDENEGSLQSEEDEEEDCNSEENFLDDQAEEASECDEESEGEPVDDDDDDDDLMFESGSTLMSKQNSIGSVQCTINSFFDLYSSDSEEDDTDLDGFIVEDDFLEYESEDNTKMSPSFEDKKINVKKKSRIIGREARESNSDVVDSIEESNQSSNLEKNMKCKRRRILSDDSEVEEKDFPEIKTKPSKKSRKENKQTNLMNDNLSNSLKHTNNDDEQENCVFNTCKRLRCKELKDGVEDLEKNKENLNINAERNLSGKKKNKRTSKKKSFEKGTSIKEKKSLDVTVVPKSILKQRAKSNSSNISLEENNASNSGAKGRMSSVCKDSEKGHEDSKLGGKQKKNVSFTLPESEDEVKYTNNNENCEKYHEDIYGRLRDKTGKIVSTDELEEEKNNKYIPPAMRKLMALNSTEKKKEQLAALQRHLKGLLNRLAESNIAGIASQIEGYYQTYSRNDVNDTLTKLLFEVLVTPVSTPERLAQEHALLIAILSANIGSEVGAHILTEFIVQWVQELEAFKPTSDDNEIDSKELDNMLLFIGQLYNFRVVDATLIYDILQKILERSLEAKEVDLILLVLRSVGFALRKDDPLGLKRLINQIHFKANDSTSKQSDHNYTRVRFMLEILTAIRNNNMTKVPNFDPSHSQHLKTLMKGLIKKGCRTSDLKISLKDLLKSKVVGKWWVVGSAWSGGLKEEMHSTQEFSVKDKKVSSSLNQYSDRFIKKAAKLHMSRPPRINILYAITEGSENYADAFEKLMQLKLASSQEQEIFNVMIYCCMRCKEYNQFYVTLALKLCKCKKGFTRLLQFSIWDKFKELKNMTQRQTANLAKFIAHLIAESSLNLSVLKTLNFVEADEKTVSFLRQVLIAILLHPTGIYAVSRAFNHLCSMPKLKVLRQYIRVFIVKFINPKTCNDKEMKVLGSRVKLVLDILTDVGGVKL